MESGTAGAHWPNMISGVNSNKKQILRLLAEQEKERKWKEDSDEEKVTSAKNVSSLAALAVPGPFCCSSECKCIISAENLNI